MRDDLLGRIRAFIESANWQDPASPDALLREVLSWQATNVAPYRTFLGSIRRAGESTPPLPTDVFRYARVASHDASMDVRTFCTSGTSDAPRGTHFFRDMSLYDLAAKSAAKHFLFPDRERMPLMILAPSETDLPDSSLSYMLARFIEWFGAPPSECAWSLAGIEVSGLEKWLRQREAAREPVALLGTSFAFVHAIDALASATFRLPRGSRIMQTGGFKGRSRELDPAAMRASLSATFGVDESWIVSEYGMTELSSQLYETTLRDAVIGASSGPRRLKAPPWVRAIPVDPATGREMPHGQGGVLRIDDLANLDSVCSLLTSDLAESEGDGVVVLGRAPQSAARGCSLGAEELLRAP